MNTYTFNLLFNSEKECSDYIEQLLEKHEDGLRSLYNGEIVWAVETQQNINESQVTLKAIKTWKKH